MIKKIAHLSDIHITKSISRHSEYRIQFNKTYNKLEKQKPDLIVIVGDLYHDYIDLEGEAEILMGEFLNRLSKIAPVIITRGNHDMRKKNKNRKDVVEAITTLINNPNITYLDKSGFYNIKNITFVVHHHLEGVNPWTDIKHTKNDKQIYIDLYHDPIQGCLGDNGYPLKNNKYRLSDFEGDFSMLGDIHLRQSYKGGRVWYPSSLIQQNFGELPEKHGYLLWTINSKDDFSVEEVDIPNDHNFINFNIKQGTDYDNLDLSHPLLNEQSEIKIHWKDLSANINYENELKIRKYFKDNYDLLGIKISQEPPLTEVSDVKMVSESIDILDPDIHRKIFTEYLEVNGYEKEYIDEILKIDDIITERLINIKDNMGISWSIDEIWFENFKSYGDNNRIKWKNNSGIYQITGINQQGKTTILDAISYVLYGKTLTTTKREKNGDNRYINNKRKLDYCSGGVVININNETYTLLRETNRKWNKKHTDITSCSSNIKYFKGTKMDNKDELTGEKKSSTQKYIESAIGEFDDFIRLVLTTADNINDLLSMDRSVFIDSVTKDAGYDIFDKKLNEFKDYRKEISKNDIKIDIKEIDALKEELNKNKSEKSNELNILNNKILEKEQSKPSIQKEKEKHFRQLYNIDDKFENFDIAEIELEIESEKEKIEKRKEQLDKIDKLKIEVQDYNNQKLKDKRLVISELKDIISEYNIDIQKYNKDISEFKSNINIINKDIDNLIENYINSLRSDIKDKELKISDLKNNFKNEIINYTSSLKDDLNNIIVNRDSYKKDISSLMEDGKKLKKTNDDLETSKVCITCERPLDDVDPEIINEKIQSNKNEMSNIKEKIDKIMVKFNIVSDKIDEYKEKLEKISNKDYSFDDNLNNSYNNYINDKKIINDDIEEVNRTIELIDEGNIPSILQERLRPSYNEKRINNDKIDEIEKKKEELETTLEYKKEELETNNKELEELEKIDESINKKKEIINLEEKVKADIERFENIIKENKRNIDEYENQLEKIEKNKEINEKISKLDNELDLIDNNIKELSKDKNNIESSIIIIDNDLSKINDDVKTYNRQQKRNEILDSYLKCVHRDGLPSYLLKKSINIINKELNNILIDVDFNLFFDDDLILKLSHDTNLEVSQNAIESSGMERTFCAVALKMALRKINNKSKPNFIMLDEIMGKLVDESVNKFITLLDVIKKEVDILVIIEHIHPINYDYLISVEKSIEGISSLKIE